MQAAYTTVLKKSKEWKIWFLRIYIYLKSIKNQNTNERIIKERKLCPLIRHLTLNILCINF